MDCGSAPPSRIAIWLQTIGPASAIRFSRRHCFRLPPVSCAISPLLAGTYSSVPDAPNFQDITTPCSKREPGSGCSARAGYNRELAILGASEACIATHPSDMAVAMAALDAVVRTLGPNGERVIPLSELHRLPGEEPQPDTVLMHGELITAVDLPPLAFATNSRYRKVRDRASYAFALVSVAAALDVADGVVRDVRIALGGVAPRPWRARQAETMLRGAPASEASFRAAAEAELAQARPLAGNAFKVPLARNVIARTLLDLAGQEQP